MLYLREFLALIINNSSRLEVVKMTKGDRTVSSFCCTVVSSSSVYTLKYSKGKKLDGVHSIAQNNKYLYRIFESTHKSDIPTDALVDLNPLYIQFFYKDSGKDSRLILFIVLLGGKNTAG